MMDGEISNEDWDRMKQIALKRKQLHDELRKALEANQVDEALRLARLVCGMPPETKH
jgi:hypothetical protein